MLIKLTESRFGWVLLLLPWIQLLHTSAELYIGQHSWLTLPDPSYIWLLLKKFDFPRIKFNITLTVFAAISLSLGCLIFRWELGYITSYNIINRLWIQTWETVALLCHVRFSEAQVNLETEVCCSFCTRLEVIQSTAVENTWTLNVPFTAIKSGQGIW